MPIKLIDLNPLDDNPFNQYPELYSIWEPNLSFLAKEAIDEAFELMLLYPDADFGHLFLIEIDSKVAGITGYFPSNQEFSEFMLRWHGLLEEHRGFGHSKIIISLLANDIKNTYPNAYSLIEITPEEHVYTRNYFEKLGFIKSGAPEKVEWSTSKWQSYVLEL